MVKHIILDCDPGHDDAIALLLAHAHPELQLRAITTVAGNQLLEKVTNNARSVARVAKLRDVPLAAGAAHPLVGEQIIPEEIHGESGLDGPQLPAPTYPLDPRPATAVMADIIASEPAGTVHLVPTGALTNVALFAATYPELVPRVAGVTLMGGAYQVGNMTPAAEFNILADPEAAAMVFQADWDVTMVGLDVTHKVLATADRLEQIQAVGTDVAQFVAELIDFFGAAYVQEYGFPGPPLHDALAVAALIDPSLVRTVRAHVDVETQGEYTRGQTVVDFRRSFQDDPAVLPVCDDAHPQARLHSVAVDCDSDRFFELLCDALTRLGTTDFRAADTAAE